MTKKIGLIIKMPTEQASPKEIEERKSKVGKLLNKSVGWAYLPNNNFLVQFYAKVCKNRAKNT